MDGELELQTAIPAAAGHGDNQAESLEHLLAAARLTVAHLATWARIYALRGAGNGMCCCGDHRCRLDGRPGGPEACRLALYLARLPLARRDIPPDLVPETAEDVVERFLQAMRAAGPATELCRTMNHPIGDCWFATRAWSGHGLCTRTATLSQLLRVAKWRPGRVPVGGRR